MSNTTRNEFLSVCESFSTAMLVTQSPDNRLVARPMMVAELEPDGDLWFTTEAESGKVDEILSHPEVCVTMAGDGKYASISGRAEIVADRERIDKLWREAWRTWFDDPTDARIALIRVHASQGEYWSDAGTNRLKYLFNVAKTYVSGHQSNYSDNSEHARVDLEP
jgi:general stress protein 26